MKQLCEVGLLRSLSYFFPVITNQMFHFVLTRLYSPRLSSINICLTRAATIKSAVDVGKEMKMLNDQKQFEKALRLFDQNNRNSNIEMCSSLTITQVLKACAQIGDLRRGAMLHQLISSRVQDDSYITASLINLYSEFRASRFCQSYLVM